jgi:hypothetical protein
VPKHIVDLYQAQLQTDGLVFTLKGPNLPQGDGDLFKMRVTTEEAKKCLGSVFEVSHQQRQARDGAPRLWPQRQWEGQVPIFRNCAHGKQCHNSHQGHQS